MKSSEMPEPTDASEAETKSTHSIDSKGSSEAGKEGAEEEVVTTKAKGSSKKNEFLGRTRSKKKEGVGRRSSGSSDTDKNNGEQKKAGGREGWKLTIRRDRSKSLSKAAEEMDKHDPARFLGEGVSFKAKLIGVLEVNEARGDRVCQEALGELKMAIKAAGEHKQRVTINIAIDGLRIRDEKTGDCLYHHPVHKISFIAQDMTDARAFGYIFGSPDTGHRFFGIKTEKAASQVVIAMRDLFQVVFELKKKEIERAKQQLEQQHHHMRAVAEKNAAALAAERERQQQQQAEEASAPPHPIDEPPKMEPIREEPKENGDILGAAKLPAPTSSKHHGAGAVADLLDLEFELNSLQQGIDQMEKITPSDPFGPLRDPFSRDPFGDSFAPPPTPPAAVSLPPPPPASAPAFPPVKDPFDTSPFSPPSMINKGYVRDPFDASNGFGPQRQSSACDRYAAFAELKEEEAAAPLAAAESVSEQASFPTEFSDPEISKMEANSVPPTSSSPYDVFTELDPLGTGKVKPYVDKKDFFQELKNPPKKVLKDLLEEKGVRPKSPPPNGADYFGTPAFVPTSNGAEMQNGSERRDSSGNESRGGDPFANVDPFADTGYPPAADPFGSVPFRPAMAVDSDPFNTSFADFTLLREKELERLVGPKVLPDAFPDRSSSPPSTIPWGPLRVALPPEEAREDDEEDEAADDADDDDSPPPYTPPPVPDSPPILPPPKPSLSSSSAAPGRQPSPICITRLNLSKPGSTSSSSRFQKQMSLGGSNLSMASGAKTLPRRLRLGAKQVSMDVPTVPRLSPPPGLSRTKDESTPPTPPRVPRQSRPFPSWQDDYMSTNGESAPEPPPRPPATIKPPPLPPKRQQGPAKPPARLPELPTDPPTYDYISKTAGPLPDDDSPPIPVPMRKARFPTAEAVPPERPAKPQAAPAAPLDVTLTQLASMSLGELANTLRLPSERLSQMTIQELATRLAEVGQMEDDNDSPKEPEFQADFESGFKDPDPDPDPDPEPEPEPFDKYAVFRELTLEEAGCFSLGEKKADSVEEPASPVMAKDDSAVEEEELLPAKAETDSFERPDEAVDEFTPAEKETPPETADSTDAGANWATFDEKKTEYNPSPWNGKEETPAKDYASLPMEPAKPAPSDVDDAASATSEMPEAWDKGARQKGSMPTATTSDNRRWKESPWEEDRPWDESEDRRYRHYEEEEDRRKYSPRGDRHYWRDNRAYPPPPRSVGGRDMSPWDEEDGEDWEDRRRRHYGRESPPPMRRPPPPTWEEERRWRDYSYDDGRRRYRRRDDYRRREPSWDEGRRRKESSSSWEDTDPWRGGTAWRRDEEYDDEYPPVYQRRRYCRHSDEEPARQSAGEEEYRRPRVSSADHRRYRRKDYEDYATTRSVDGGYKSAGRSPLEGSSGEDPFTPTPTTARRPASADAKPATQRQSPFEDDFIPPDAPASRHNSDRVHSSMSVSSDVSDHRSPPDERRKPPEEPPKQQSLEDVFLPSDAPTKFADFDGAFTGTSRPNGKTRRQSQSPQEDIARERPRPSRVKSSGSVIMKKSESVNIFQRESDPFDDDFFSSPLAEEDEDDVEEDGEEGGAVEGEGGEYERASTSSSGGVGSRRHVRDGGDWEHAFHAFNFQKEK